MPFALNPYADFLDLVHGDNDPTLQLERFLRTEVKNPIADPWQTEVLESTASTIAICVARQVGKSCVLAAKAIRALERGHTVLATAPAERQVKLLTRKVAQYLRTTNLVIERSTLPEIETSNGGHWVAVPITFHWPIYAHPSQSGEKRSYLQSPPCSFKMANFCSRQHPPEKRGCSRSTS